MGLPRVVIGEEDNKDGTNINIGLGIVLLDFVFFLITFEVSLYHTPNDKFFFHLLYLGREFTL